MRYEKAEAIMNAGATPLPSKQLLRVSYAENGDFEVKFTLASGLVRPIDICERLLRRALDDTLELLGASHNLAEEPTWRTTDDTIVVNLGLAATGRERVVTQFCWDISTQSSANNAYIDTRRE